MERVINASSAGRARRGLWFVVASALVWVGLSQTANAQPTSATPSFALDVMPVLARAGCNQGACHGNLNGKGGLKLSLRGQEPDDDYQTLVRDFGGRRVNSLVPSESLLLLKAVGKVVHLGGVRFQETSPEYAILRDWIAAGCPPAAASTPRVASLEVAPRDVVLVAPRDSVPLVVTAAYTDGSRRDVTRLTAFDLSNLVATVDADGVVRRQTDGETTVVARYLDQQTPVRIAFVPDRPPSAALPAPATWIDSLWQARWRELRVQPATQADEATLVRRLFLDLLGILPSEEEAREFVSDSGPDRWERWIDRLVARPEFAERWALAWSDVLRVEEKVLDNKGVERFHAWIRDSFRRQKPLDQFVRELVTATGSTYETPPANFYRALRDPVTRGETVGRLFLGVRLQCAQCHNHPFDRWTQDEYYQWAALFARVEYQILENQKKDKLDSHEFVGEQIVKASDVGEVRNPRTRKDAIPKFLGADTPEMEPNSDRREPLAEWLTSPSNGPFARSQVNFVWYHLFGRGLVEPVDDLRPTNPPSHPELFERLAAEFARDGFDHGRLVRTLVATQTYRLSADSPDGVEADESLFARAIVRRLPAETLLDAQSQVLDVPVRFTGYDAGLRAGQLPGVRRSRDRDRKAGEGDRFLATFGKPQRLLACACERSQETTLKQALTLMSDADLQRRLDDSQGRLERWLQDRLPVDELVERLYWTTLSRAPTPEEQTRAAQWLADDRDRPAALRDLAWALLNAKEFLFRH